MKKYEMLEKLINELGETETLNALVDAMDIDEMTMNYNYICRMYDIENENSIRLEEDFDLEEEDN